MINLKSIIILLAFLFVIALQGQVELIKDIREKYNFYNSNADKFEKVEIDIIGESTEGGHATAFIDKSEIKIINATWYGETGKKSVEYYYEKEELFFALEISYEYNMPIYIDEERAKAEGFSDYFDYEKTEIKENRYYFHNNNLILWLNENKSEVDLDQNSINKKEFDIFENAKELIRKFKKVE